MAEQIALTALSEPPAPSAVMVTTAPAGTVYSSEAPVTANVLVTGAAAGAATAGGSSPAPDASALTAAATAAPRRPRPPAGPSHRREPDLRPRMESSALRHPCVPPASPTCLDLKEPSTICPAPLHGKNLPPDAESTTATTAGAAGAAKAHYTTTPNDANAHKVARSLA